MEDIADLIGERFLFLIDEHGCQVYKQEVDNLGAFVTYSNKNAGLRVSYEPREGGVYVMIFALEDGSIPGYESWFDFLDFLRAKRIPMDGMETENHRYARRERLKSTIGNYALLVREYLGDYLAGDFSVVPELEEIVDRRKQEFLSKR